jgi:hypothetical protein
MCEKEKTFTDKSQFRFCRSGKIDWKNKRQVFFPLPNYLSLWSAIKIVTFPMIIDF